MDAIARLLLALDIGVEDGDKLVRHLVIMVGSGEIILHHTVDRRIDLKLSIEERRAQEVDAIVAALADRNIFLKIISAEGWGDEANVLSEFGLPQSCMVARNRDFLEELQRKLSLRGICCCVSKI